MIEMKMFVNAIFGTAYSWHRAQISFRAIGSWLLLVLTTATVANSQVSGTKLLASDGAAGGYFGIDVSLDGDYALVGADADQGAYPGSGYLFKWEGSSWIEAAKLSGDDSANDDAFGYAVSLSGDWAMLGAHLDDDQGSNSGSAYMFHRVDSTWTQLAKLVPSDGATDSHFGGALSIDGDYALIGAWGDTELGEWAGAAYIFHWDGNAWMETAKLLADDGIGFSYFGGAVSLDGDYALVGAYVFHRVGSAWSQVAKLSANDAAPGDGFGTSVALDGIHALVGANGDDDNGSSSGSAYIFERTGAVWNQVAKLLPDDGAAFDEFGYRSAIDGEYALIGANGGQDGGPGAAYVFQHYGFTWVQVARLTADDGAPADRFGYSSVSLDDDHALVGALFDDDQGDNSGTAFLFSGISALTVGVLGDVNQDGSANILDEILLVNAIIGLLPIPDLGTAQFALSDVNADGVLDIADVIGIVNIILGRPIGDGVPEKPITIATISVGPILSTNERSVIPIDIESPYDMSGLQAAVDYDPTRGSLGTPFTTVGTVQSYAADGILRFAVYGESGQSIDSKVYIPILWGNPIIRLSDVILVDGYGRRITSTLSGNKVSSLPTSFGLVDASPNPFNPSTTIAYEVPEPTSVRITVYNMLGQEIVRLVDGQHTPGRYSITWDGRNASGVSVASGIYMYRMESGEYSESKRMVLVK
jgi:hypothetical protein